jgi:MFS superfamily sulfate permease-like transporter
VIIAMAGVPVVDVSCVQALERLWADQAARGGTLYVAGAQHQPLQVFERAGLLFRMGATHFVTDVDRALAGIAGASEQELHAEALLPLDDALDELPFGMVTAQ